MPQHATACHSQLRMGQNLWNYHIIWSINQLWLRDHPGGLDENCQLRKRFTWKIPSFRTLFSPMLFSAQRSSPGLLQRNLGDDYMGAILVRVGLVETRTFFWLSWIDLHGICTTLMCFFHILRPFRTNFLCFPWWKNDCEVWRGFLFLFFILCWVTFVYKPACPNARITWERKERSIKSMLKVIWER